MKHKYPEYDRIVEMCITLLNGIEVDGETTEYILNKLNMREQILQQLVMTCDDDVVNGIINEKQELYGSLSELNELNEWDELDVLECQYDDMFVVN